jgi:hypothetical protein
MDPRICTNEICRQKLEAEREKVKELSRCLSYAECPECSEYFIKDPRDCLLADHIEAYRAIIDDKPKGESNDDSCTCAKTSHGTLIRDSYCPSHGKEPEPNPCKTTEEV